MNSPESASIVEKSSIADAIDAPAKRTDCLKVFIFCSLLVIVGLSKVQLLIYGNQFSNSEKCKNL